MHQLEQDLTYVQSAVHDLENYLISDVLYWPIRTAGNRRLPAGMTQITIGNLLLSLKRLKALMSADGQEKTRLNSLLEEIERIKERGKSKWTKKVIEEIRSRLRQWDHYLEELKSGEISHGDYIYNIRQRVILDMLMAELDQALPREQARLQALDESLRSSTHPANFIWDADLQLVFPQDAYWYLYRTPA